MKKSAKVHKSLKGWPYHKVFLTGATGLIGGRVLGELIQLPQVEEVVCLARSSNGHAGTERLARRLKRDGLKGEELEAAMSRVRGVEGNITSELWGLDEEALTWIRSEADLFIHCAASTNFTDIESCEAINVEGTRQLLEIVRGATALKRLVHFSTATVAGHCPNAVLKEEESLECGASHMFAYTRTKAEAERILREAADEIPLLIVRPSITMARGTRDRKQARLFLWGFIAMSQLPFVPLRRESLIDFVTLDFVVQSTMRLIARGDKLKHDCYHLTAGKMAAISAGELYDVACAKSTREELPVVVPPENWDESHSQAITEQGLKTLSEAVHLYMPFANLNLIYDNSRLIEELADDLPELPKFTEYMNEMIATIDPELVTTSLGRAFGATPTQ